MRIKRSVSICGIIACTDCFRSTTILLTKHFSDSHTQTQTMYVQPIYAFRVYCNKCSLEQIFNKRKIRMKSNTQANNTMLSSAVTYFIFCKFMSFRHNGIIKTTTRNFHLWPEALKQKQNLL